MKSLMLLMTVGTLFSATTFAQSGPASVSARAGIDAGNQAWVDGVKTGNIALIIATYADDAVDCGSSGECVRGRLEIERHMKTQLASLGPARSAAVASAGSTQQGDFAYEWGQAEATYAGGQRVVEKYLTAWQRQADGSWKIFRNMVIPIK
jgi:ketosteroid isomerase-like protein